MITLEVEEPAIRLFGRMIQVQRAPNDDVLALCYSPGSVFIQAPSSSSSSSSSSTTKSSMVSKVSRAVSPCSEEQELKKRSKKQSKLLLACPRCKSGATKFCYFNNYNSKQPRHFCKGCQRYWTAGGSMRSMVVGAGRRKLKKPAAAATISMQRFSPIWPNPNCGFFPVPAYAATAAPYWAWVDPRVQLKESLSSVWAPKTVRFDDASDMAKTTFWSNLGI